MRYLFLLIAMLGVVGCAPCSSKDLVCNYTECMDHTDSPLDQNEVREQDKERCRELAHARAMQRPSSRYDR